MAKLKLTEYKAHPKGLYEFEVIRIEEDESPYGPIFKIGCQSNQGELIVRASQKYTLGKKPSKLGELAVAAYNEKPPQELDTDDLFGRKFQGLVEHRVDGDATYGNITKFLAVGQEHDIFADK